MSTMRDGVISEQNIKDNGNGTFTIEGSGTEFDGHTFADVDGHEN